MKDKISIISIVLLLIAIVYVNYNFIFSSKNNDNHEGQVKSAFDINSNSEDFSLSNKIDIHPVKNDNYYDPEHIWSNSFIVVDVDSANILASKNEFESVPIASTTKIMTAIIALENYDLDEIITVSNEAFNQIGSYSGIMEGEQITVNNLLYCLLIKSGNDAAYALAEHMGFDNFISKMNEKAKYLGLKNTKFMDPAGLNDKGNSSAFDLAFTARYAMLNKVFREIVSTKEITVGSIDGSYQHNLENSNRLIKDDEPLYLPYATGVKTGFTPDAGHCLVSSALKDNHEVIAVVLHTYEDTNEASAKESKKLLEWVFENYHWK